MSEEYQNRKSQLTQTTPDVCDFPYHLLDQEDAVRVNPAFARLVS
jgi:hypothetical protein